MLRKIHLALCLFALSPSAGLATKTPNPLNNDSWSYINYTNPLHHKEARSAILVATGLTSLTVSALTGLVSSLMSKKIESIESDIASLIYLLDSHLRQVQLSECELDLIKSIESNNDNAEPLKIHSTMNKKEQIQELKNLLKSHYRLITSQKVCVLVAALAFGVGATCLVINRLPSN